MQALDTASMKLGARIDERRKAAGISQAELARRVGVRQSTINGLINGDARSSRFIVQIAQELRTTPAFLAGQIDDPDLNAAPPPPSPIQFVRMQVALPSEPALARMFSALLKGIDPAATLDEQALLLAQRLPIGLSQLQDLAPARSPDQAAPPAPAAAPAPPARQHREPTR